jgi:putative flippase GtrA
VHAGAFVVVAEVTGASGLWSNFAAFACAFSVSFLGHFHWTFRARAAGSEARLALLRFLVVALIGLALTTTISYVLVDEMGGSRYLAAGLMVTVVPITTFLLSRNWAFAAPTTSSPQGRKYSTRQGG